MSKKPEKLFDVREIERNLRQGSIDQADVQKYLDSLPDVSSKAVTLGQIEDKRAAEAAAAVPPPPPAPAPTPAPPAMPASEPEYAAPHLAAPPVVAPAVAEPAATPEAPTTTTPDPLS